MLGSFCKSVGRQKNICKYLYMHAFNSIAMINNQIICMIFVPGIVFTWFQIKRSNIEWWVVIVITVNDFIF